MSVSYIPIRRQLVPDSIARQIQQLIVTRALKPGDKLASERELAAALGVGRSAVREAIKLMAGVGILEVRQGAGTFVTRAQLPPLEDISQLPDPQRREMLAQATHARRLIDVEVVTQAAMLVTDAQLAEMEAHLADSEVEPARTKREFALDLGFEALIGRATGNPYLIDLQKRAHTMFEAAWRSGGFIPRPAGERNRQHLQILAALRARDPKAASRLMTKHLDVLVGRANASKRPGSKVVGLKRIES